MVQLHHAHWPIHLCDVKPITRCYSLCDAEKKGNGRKKERKEERSIKTTLMTLNRFIGHNRPDHPQNQIHALHVHTMIESIFPVHIDKCAKQNRIRCIDALVKPK